MSSSESPSPDSTDEMLQQPDRLRMAGSDGSKPRRARTVSASRWRERKVTWSNWPVFFLLPALVAIVQAAAFTPFMHMLFGESFGLTQGRQSPWPGGIAIVGLVGFYVTLFLGRYVANPVIAQILAGVAWLVVTLAWIATDRDYDVAGLIRDPWSLVSEHGYMVGLIFAGMGFWYQGIRYATDAFLTGADELRAMVQRAWGVLIIGIVLAAVMNNASGDTAVSATRWAVPICAIASMALIAAGETESARAAARRRGATGPNWSRWLRISGLVTGISAILSLIFVVLLGPDALRFLVTAAGQLLRLIGIALGYIAYGIFYLLYQIIRAVYYLLELIFGDLSIERPEAPEQPGGMPEQGPIEPGQQPQPWEQAELIRWVILAVAIILVGLVIFRIRRRATIDADNNALDEARDSVFSSNLLRDQLKGLFRRGQKGAGGPRTLDLDVPPTSVREAYQYLSVLAERQAVGRLDAETPEDFAWRLRAQWPGTADDLDRLTRAYESVRYGTGPNDDTSAIVPPWSSIYAHRKDIPEPTDGKLG